MPNENTPNPEGENKPVIKPVENAEAHNKEIAAKLVSQDINGNSTAAKDIQDAASALDQLALKRQEGKKSEDTADGDPDPEDKSGTPPAKPTAPPATPPSKTAEEIALDKKVEELFKDCPTLPPNASPKSADAFSGVKIRAAKEVSALSEQVDKLNKELSEMKEKLKNPIPADIEAELKSHREFRAKVDVEADPKFKSFDKAINESREFIYAQLAKSPAVTPDVIAEIKKHGGPENVILTKLFDSIKDPTLQRLVESKVADIEVAKFNRDQMLKTTKENIGQYLKEKAEQYSKASTDHLTHTQERLGPMLNALEKDWFVEKTPGDKATAEEKADIADHNKFVTETRNQLAYALKDDSPEMRAVLLTGMAQLFNLQREHKKLKVSTDSQIESLTKERDEAVAKYDKLKAGSTTRLREGNAPPNGAPKPKPANNINVPTLDAIDAVARQVMEEKAAKRSAGN